MQWKQHWPNKMEFNMTIEITLPWQQNWNTNRRKQASTGKSITHD